MSSENRRRRDSPRCWAARCPPPVASPSAGSWRTERWTRSSSWAAIPARWRSTCTGARPWSARRSRTSVGRNGLRPWRPPSARVVPRTAHLAGGRARAARPGGRRLRPRDRPARGEPRGGARGARGGAARTRPAASAAPPADGRRDHRAGQRGKSTLFNALLGKDEALVSDVEGTTRDVIAGACELEGRPLVLTPPGCVRSRRRKGRPRSRRRNAPGRQEPPGGRTSSWRSARERTPRPRVRLRCASCARGREIRPGPLPPGRRVRSPRVSCRNTRAVSSQHPRALRSRSGSGAEVAAGLAGLPTPFEPWMLAALEGALAGGAADARLETLPAELEERPRARREGLRPIAFGPDAPAVRKSDPLRPDMSTSSSPKDTVPGSVGEGAPRAHPARRRPRPSPRLDRRRHERRACALRARRSFRR